MQLLVEFLQRQRHHVVMVERSELRVERDLFPHLVQLGVVLVAQPRRVRAERVLLRGAVGRGDLHGDARLGLGQPLPGVARQLGLLIGHQRVG